MKLKDELVSSLQFQKVKDYELAWVDAVLKTRNVQTENEKQISVSNSALDFGYSLHPLPKEEATTKAVGLEADLASKFDLCRVSWRCSRL